MMKANQKVILNDVYSAYKFYELKPNQPKINQIIIAVTDTMIRQLILVEMSLEDL